MRRRAILIISMLVVLAASYVGGASVDPETVEATLAPGESLEVVKHVILPDFPQKLDLYLVVDLSGSYFDDLPNIKSKAPDIYDGVVAVVPDSTFGLGSFVDYPFNPWGDASSGDYAYQLDQDQTADKTTWTTAVSAMALKFGFDEPESQYEAFYQAATGAGRDIPGTLLGDIAPGQDPSFRADATKVIALTTDASFHVPTDGPCSSPTPPCPILYPGPSEADTIAALNAAGIKVIAIKAPGSTTQMDDIATATGGTVVTTSATSEEITEAIVGALDELTFDVTGTPVGCDPLEVTIDPAVREDIPSGGGTSFTETITVPADIAPEDVDENGDLTCTVEFKADGTVIGIETIKIHVDFGANTCETRGLINAIGLSGNDDTLARQLLGTKNEDGPLSTGLHDVDVALDALPPVGNAGHEGICVVAAVEDLLGL